jgi:hypothetical protein
MASRKGKKNLHLPQIETSATRCPKCRSTERDHYSRRRVVPYYGADPDGCPCTRVVFRWTRCLACGQARIDKFYENITPTE